MTATPVEVAIVKMNKDVYAQLVKGILKKLVAIRVNVTAFPNESFEAYAIRECHMEAERILEILVDALTGVWTVTTSTTQIVITRPNKTQEQEEVKAMIDSKHITEKALEFVTAFQNADMDDLWEAAFSLEPEHDKKPLSLAERDAYVMLEALANEREERKRAAFKMRASTDDHACCDDHD